MAEKRPAAGRPLWLVITLVSILMALAGIGAAYLTTTFLSDAWSRGQINLVDRFTRGTPNPDWPYLDAEDRTEQVCGAPVNCVQAVGNEYLTLLKFGSVGAATDYAEILGTDAVQIDPLVVHFDGTELSTETREGIIYTLSSDNASSPD